MALSQFRNNVKNQIFKKINTSKFCTNIFPFMFSHTKYGRYTPFQLSIYNLIDRNLRKKEFGMDKLLSISVSGSDSSSCDSDGSSCDARTQS